MTISGLHHVAVICSDYPVSKRFYTEVLGLRVVSETHRAEPERLSYPESPRIEASGVPGEEP